MTCSFHSAYEHPEAAVPMFIILAILTVLVSLGRLVYLWTTRTTHAGLAELPRDDGLGAAIGEDASGSPSNMIVATPRPMRRLLTTETSPDLSSMQASWECMSPLPTTPPRKRRRKATKAAEQSKGGAAVSAGMPLLQELDEHAVLKADFDCVSWTSFSSRSSKSMSHMSSSRRSPCSWSPTTPPNMSKTPATPVGAAKSADVRAGERHSGF